MNNGEKHTNDLLSAYHDGEVTAAEREAVEKLLAESPEARAEFEDYQRISAELRDTIDNAPSIDVSDAVLASIRKPVAFRPEPHLASTKKSRSLRSVWPLGIAAAIAACVLIGIGLFLKQDVGPLGMPVAGEAIDHAATPPPRAMADHAAETMAFEPTPVESAGTMAESPPAASVAAGGMGRDGMYLSGENARPPAGVSVGDVYSYIKRTEAGDIVVVQAYVLDVRKAVDQLQVLLARNEIPTAQVSRLDGELLNFDAPAARPGNDLAVYVESDPERVKLALEDLHRQLGVPTNAIQGIQIAGVLDSPAAAGSTSFSQPTEELFLETEAPGRKSAVPAPKHRALIPHDRPAMSQQDRARFAIPEDPAASVAEPGDGSLPASRFDFQTVLNVSNSAINEQLRQQQIAPATAPETPKSNVVEPAAPLMAKSDAAGPPRPERRLRLLLVLQQRPPAVEAPRP